MEKPQRIHRLPWICIPLFSYPWFCLPLLPISYVDVFLNSFSSFSKVTKHIQLKLQKRTKYKQSSKQQ